MFVQTWLYKFVADLKKTFLEFNFKFDPWSLKFTIFYLLENQMQSFPSREETLLCVLDYGTVSTAPQQSSKKKEKNNRFSDEERYLIRKCASVHGPGVTFKQRFWLITLNTDLCIFFLKEELSSKYFFYIFSSIDRQSQKLIPPFLSIMSDSQKSFLQNKTFLRSQLQKLVPQKLMSTKINALNVYCFLSNMCLSMTMEKRESFFI